MSTKLHRLAAAAIAAVTACVLSVPVASGTLDAGKFPTFDSYPFVPTALVAAPAISLAPKVRPPFRWYRWHPSTRVLQGKALEARDRAFGGHAVIGVESNGDLQKLRKAYGFRAVTPIPQLHAAAVRVDRAHLDALLAAAPNDERIRYVSPVPHRQLQHLRNDPFLNQIDPTTGAPYEWQFFASRVDRALNITHGSPNVLACTIDTGAADVPDLAGKVVSRWYFVGQTPTQATGGTDVQGHGTAVASLIAANVGDGIGIAGFGGAVRIISFRDDDLADTSSAIAMTKLVSLGCKIINMSFGSPDPVSGILKDAIDRAFAQGVLLVASAGNDGADQPVLHPAADLQPDGGAPSMGLAVGASNFVGRAASFSNSGSRLSLLAPGDYDNGCSGVFAPIANPSSMFDGSCWARPGLNGSNGAHYGSLGGTSFSAPEVAGVAALVWAARPDLNNVQVAEIIKRSARHDGPTWTPDRGFGVLDAAAAVEMATGRSSADALKLADLRAARSVKWATVSGRVTWSDDDPATDAIVTCSAAGLHTVLSASQGTFKCSWRVPTTMARKTIRAVVSVTDPQLQTPLTQVFTLGHPRVP